jgi:hypothetical protein
MPANPTKIRFRRKMWARDALVPDIPSTRSRVGATAHRGALVRRPIGRRILACRWVAVEGGRLECRWSIEVVDGSSREEPKSSLWVRRPPPRYQTISNAARLSERWDELEA